MHKQKNAAATTIPGVRRDATALHAELRAGAGRNRKVTFPIVAIVPEVRAARDALEACRAELQAGGMPAAEGMRTDPHRGVE